MTDKIEPWYIKEYELNPHPNEVLYGKTSDIIHKIMEEVNHLVIPLEENRIIIEHNNGIGTDIFIGADVIRTREKHYLDVRYPHICFKCKTPVIFRELFNANRRNYEYGKLQFDMPLYRRLKKMWKSRFVEFFCCTCHRKKQDIELIVAKQERLKRKAKRICEKFGFDFNNIDFEFRKLE